MKKAFMLGICASFFFAFTFILNQQMHLSGGSWYWSSSLRYIFMLPMLLIIMISKRQLKEVIIDIRKKPLSWLLWSTIGFGFFYAPLSFASSYGASWLVAGTWQLTIVAGGLMSPLFFKIIKTEKGIVKIRNKIPKKSLLISLLILVGIALMYIEEATDISLLNTMLVIIPVIIAAFSYPIGNRKMMEICDSNINTIQRVFGMTLCSMPFWIIISLLGISNSGLPGKSQLIQSFIVAVFSGIIATILFFKATDIVKDNSHNIAIIESTQAGEVVFTLLGGILIFHDTVPTTLSLIGLIIVVLGMILNSFVRS
ncbi:MAG: multidrug resistance efflux transporter family protein [Clostridium butyricum]|uniref:DMT family transporter n=1 Tax=Clostridium TaxID=1485 RepID=UPI0006A7B146|nr:MULTISPECIES: multidrug resistance efflux transporter family protein [Clostridium]MBO1686608.1 multidrug resistance efflux transporter family protein [Clostridium butyricum]MDB2136989.1 multidrug resistance efflux transporter family protein [Clostridium butyricum]MDI9208765.1 multidrug resistance efflux transporter family protein [Clostridium butyricum]MDU1116287.1 multidrug resistance efflux transporter family protein [Clostridium sp.]MDU4587625.1 multidrug resistance efflux transporter fa